MLIKSLLTPPSTLIDFLSLKIKGILKLSFGLYPQVWYIVIILSFKTENRINIDQNYKSGDVWSEEFPIVSVKLFYWLEYFIQKSRTSLSDRSQFVAICVVCRPGPGVMHVNESCTNRSSPAQNKINGLRKNKTQVHNLSINNSIG